MPTISTHGKLEYNIRTCNRITFLCSMLTEQRHIDFLLCFYLLFQLGCSFRAHRIEFKNAGRLWDNYNDVVVLGESCSLSLSLRRFCLPVRRTEIMKSACPGLPQCSSTAMAWSYSVSACQHHTSWMCSLP